MLVTHRHSLEVPLRRCWRLGAYLMAVLSYCEHISAAQRSVCHHAMRTAGHLPCDAMPLSCVCWGTGMPQLLVLRCCVARAVTAIGGLERRRWPWGKSTRSAQAHQVLVQAQSTECYTDLNAAPGTSLHEPQSKHSIAWLRRCLAVIRSGSICVFVPSSQPWPTRCCHLAMLDHARHRP